jgi:hypothetical protein
MEWNLTAFEGISKDKNIYRFQGDLAYEEYIEQMKRYFTGIEIIESRDFADPPLAKFGTGWIQKLFWPKKRTELRKG